MEGNKKRVKLFTLGSIAIIALLLIITIFQIVYINRKNAELEQQRIEMSRLENELNYYKNHQNDTDDEYYDIVDAGEL